MELRVKELCREKGLRMSDLADKMCVDQANLTASLKGNPTLGRLQDVANVLGVEVQDLFVKREPAGEIVRGFVETAGRVFSVKDEDALLEAVAAVPGMAVMPLYRKLSDLREAVRAFVHGNSETGRPDASMFGQVGRHEVFCLSSSADYIPEREGEEPVENRVFVLSLLRKGVTYTYELIEYGLDGEYDLDSPQGLARMIVNDIEWVFESSDSATE